MTCYLDLSAKKRHKLISLTDDLQQSSFVKVGESTVTFSDPSLFTEERLPSLTISQNTQAASDNAVLATDNVVVRFGVGSRFDLNKGISCLKVNDLNSATFSVDNVNFVLKEAESEPIEGYISVNLGASTLETALNIAECINNYCTRIFAYTEGPLVILDRSYYTAELHGIVRKQIILNIPTFPNNLQFDIVTDTDTYTFIGLLDGEERDAGTTQYFKITSSYSETVKSLQKAFCNVRVLGFCDSNETGKVVIYCSDIVQELNNYIGLNPSDITVINSVSKTPIVTLTNNLTEIPLVNIDASAGKSLIAQITNEIVNEYSSDIIDISFNGDDVKFNLNNNIQINNYAGFIYLNTVESLASKPILSKCVEYLNDSLNDLGVESKLYSHNDYSVCVETDDTITVGTGINVYTIGSEEYPSSSVDRMSLYDFSDFITDNNEVGVIVTKSSDNQEDTLVISDRTSRLSLNIVIDNYTQITKDFINFTNCNVNIKVLRSRVHLDNSKLLRFDNCFGKIEIEACEFMISNYSSVIETSQCANLEVVNKFSSYLLATITNDVKLFNFIESFINLTTKANVFDRKVSENSCSIYVISGITGQVICTGGIGDKIRENVVYYVGGIFVNMPAISSSENKIMCGLYDSNASDHDNLREWSFELTADSVALNVIHEDIEDLDIDNRSRKLSKFYGESLLNIQNFLGVYLDEDDYFSIDNERFYLSDYVSDAGLTNEKLARMMVEVLSNSKYHSYYTSDSGINFVCEGLVNIKLCTHLALAFHIDDSNYFYVAHDGNKFYRGKTDGKDNIDIGIDKAKYQVDFGARQKHTDFDITYYVDTIGDSSSNRTYRAGTKDNQFYCQDMIENIVSSYPRFGNTSFVMYGKSSNVQTLESSDLSIAFCSAGDVEYAKNHAVLYGDVCLTSTFRGLREVPCFIADSSSSEYLLTLGCKGDASFTFDNIMVTSNDGIIWAEADHPNLTININNCIVKSINELAVQANRSNLNVFESTLIANKNGHLLECVGVLKFEANVYGYGSLDTDSYYKILNEYNYHIVEEGETVESGTNIESSVNCIQDEAFSSDVNVGISSFELREDIDNKAINLIPSIYSLTLNNPTMTLDIGGRHRCSDEVKTSIDCGAVESKQGLVDPEIVVYYVNLGGAKVKQRSDANYISWDNLKEKLESLETIDKIYKIYLTGYHNSDSTGYYNTDSISIKENVAFYEQAKLHFIGSKDCVFDGDSFLNIQCEYATVIIEKLIVRVSQFFVMVFNAPNFDLTLMDCFVVDKNGMMMSPLLALSEQGTLKMFNCSFLVSEPYRPFISGDANTITTYCIGCVAQGTSNNKFYPNGLLVKTSAKGQLTHNHIDDTDFGPDIGTKLLDASLCTKEILTSEDTKLLYEPNNKFAIIEDDLTNEELVNVLKLGLSLDWNHDIHNNIRRLTLNPIKVASGNLDTIYRDNKLFCSPGCYNSYLEDYEGIYTDKPNREITCITEIGRTMITKMLSNIVRFKIEGFALCSDGYDFSNPVKSVKIEGDIKREQYLVELTSDSLAGITVKLSDNFVLREGVDFIGSGVPKRTAMNNLVNAINLIRVANNEEHNSEYLNVSSPFGAAIVPNTDTFILNKIMPCISEAYSDDNDSIDFPQSHFNVTVLQHSTEYNPNDCLKYQVLPKVGSLKFDKIEYLPLALSLYYRIDREVWNGGFGGEIVLARVTECVDDSALLGYVFPLCVCHHGLITKGNDSFVTGRIILQI